VNQRIFSRVAIYVVFLGTLISFQTPTASAVVASNPAAVCSGATCTVTFPSAGDFYSWTTPLSGEFILEVWGGQGGVRSGGGGAGGIIYHSAFPVSNQSY
jgi:hypothetical protein